MPANPRTAEETPNLPDESQCQPLRAGQLGRNAIATIEELHRSVLKAVQCELSELLQVPVAVNFRDTIQSPLSVALNRTGSGDRAIELDLAPFQGRGYLIFPPSLLFRVLDILLATPEQTTSHDSADPSQRSVTGIELYILREFFEVFARSLRAAWAPVYPAAFSQLPPRPDDDTAAASEAGDDSALVLSTSIELAGLTTDVHLILPTFLARMAHLKSAGATGRDGSGEPAGSIIQCLGGASLNIDAVLQGASIRIRDLLAMAPGQILTLGNSEDSSLECLVNGRRQFTGMLVPSGSQCAFRIDSLTGQTESHLNAGSSLER